MNLYACMPHNMTDSPDRSFGTSFAYANDVPIPPLRSGPEPAGDLRCYVALRAGIP